MEAENANEDLSIGRTSSAACCRTRRRPVIQPLNADFYIIVAFTLLFSLVFLLTLQTLTLQTLTLRALLMLALQTLALCARSCSPTTKGLELLVLLLECSLFDLLVVHSATVHIFESAVFYFRTQLVNLLGDGLRQLLVNNVKILVRMVTEMHLPDNLAPLIGRGDPSFEVILGARTFFDSHILAIPIHRVRGGGTKLDGHA